MFNEKNFEKRTVNKAINTRELPFVKLKELVGTSQRIYGYFFTNGDYGKQLVCVTKDKLINMPNRYLSTFEEWSDEERVSIIEGGLVLADIREYLTKTGKTCIIFDYMDAE